MATNESNPLNAIQEINDDEQDEQDQYNNYLQDNNDVLIDEIEKNADNDELVELNNVSNKGMNFGEQLQNQAFIENDILMNDIIDDIQTRQ